VARRIEIELTSARPDGSWTWRAAGARQPRGVLDGGLLHDGAKAGDVLKAEAEFEIEGITIVSVLAPKESTRPEPQRIEIIGSGRPDAPGVTTRLVGRSERRPGDRRRDHDDARPRHDREDGRPRRERDSGSRSSPGRATTRPRRDGPPADAEATGETEERQDGQPDAIPGRSGRRPRPEGRERRERPVAPSDRAGQAPAATGRASGRPPGPRPERTSRRATRADDAQITAPRSRRFNPGHAHRQAVMASLPPEQQPVAEQVLRGGIPAVRTALHLEREKAVAEGRPAPNTDQLIAMAEALLPRLKAAEWRDRAEAAAKNVDDISIRDLRSVVAGADAARDDETRALAATLRDALARRVDETRARWSEEVAKHLQENRVVRALRLAGRPPEPAARLGSELTEQLNQAASNAMSPDTPTERWLALLDAVAASPVRRSVKPVGLPAEPSPELRRAVHQQSGRIPALASMLGITIPPPPARAPARRRSRPTGAAAASSADPATAGPAESVATDEMAPTEAAVSPAASTAPNGDREDEAFAVRDVEDAPPVPEPVPSSGGGAEDPVVVEELGEPLGER
jgi:hypothetical protein